MFLKVNRPKVISEVFEDEVVAVNFDTGSYYGMSNTAREIWLMLDQGTSADAISEALGARYGVVPSQIRGEVDNFLEQLARQGLVATCESGNGEYGLPGQTGGSHWQPPALSVYEDMQDLLLLDPIHDVDETGWPARKPETSNVE